MNNPIKESKPYLHTINLTPPETVHPRDSYCSRIAKISVDVLAHDRAEAYEILQKRMQKRMQKLLGDADEPD